MRLIELKQHQEVCVLLIDVVNYQDYSARVGMCSTDGRVLTRENPKYLEKKTLSH